MNHRLGRMLRTSTILVASILPLQTTFGQNATPSLEDELTKQYKEAVLVIQQDGLVGLPPSLPDSLWRMCPQKYQDGKLTKPNWLCIRTARQVAHDLPKGAKFHVVKIEVNQKNDRVLFSIAECDSCNNVSAPSWYKSSVSFQFPKGYISGADAGQISDVISQLLSVDSGTAYQQQDSQPEQAKQVITTRPPTIQTGQCIDDVVAILGQPEKMVDLGSTKIYVYKELKVTFVDGKVTDVQ